jgi:uncharacterized protein
MDLRHSSKEDDHPYTKPLPRITPLNKPFWEFAARSIFALQTCDSCGDAHVPPSPVCPQCLSASQTWKPSSGRGTLESWVDFHRAYWDGFQDELPYRVCLVRLDEGPLFVSNLIGVQNEVRVGTRLRATFERATEEIVVPKFVLD